MSSARRTTPGDTTIATDISPSAPRIDPVERFVLRLARYEPLETRASEDLRRAVRASLRFPVAEVHRENMQPDLYILLEGWMCHFKLLGNGRRQITSVMVPGDLIDFGFLTGRPAHLQFRTTTPSQIGTIPVSVFANLSENHPGVMRAALRALTTETAIREELVTSLGVRSAEERLSHFLCELQYRLTVVGLVGPSNAFDLPMTQSDLAEVLGLSTVHVNRILQRLRRSGLLTLRGRRVTLLEPERLAAVSGFDPAYLRQEPRKIPGAGNS